MARCFKSHPAGLPPSRIARRAEGLITSRQAPGGARPRKRPVGATPPGDKVDIQTGSLEHAEHDSADERECDIRGYNAQSAD
jgi:hypothetical protein